jgi:predicted Ser/Thr protein kinase
VSSELLSKLDSADRARLEAILLEFDSQWGPDRFDVVADGLPGGVFRTAALREMVKIDLERHARNGSHVSLQAYLSRFSELLDDGKAPTELLDAETAAKTGGESHAPAALTGQFGRYVIVRPLGRGSMGSVYLAHDTELDRPVALKVPHFPADDFVAAERFAREARAAATIDHPNVCRVYDVGRIGATPYMTMAYVEGRSLGDELAGGPLPTRRAVELIRDVATGLAEAHRLGVIHRDLKPANILIATNGRPLVTDFGLARRTGSQERQLTGEGEVIGTPLYMSPEQMGGATSRIGPASDIYALGAVLYEALTGRPPFVGTRTDVFLQALNDAPMPPSSRVAGLDARLDPIVLRALAKKPGERFAGMIEFAAALDEWLHTGAATTRRRRWYQWFGWGTKGL